MKNLLRMVYLIVTILLVVSCASKGLAVDKSLEVIDKDTILEDVLVISSDDMEGRAPGTPGEEKTTDYISKRFKENSLQSFNNSYYQLFEMIGNRKVKENSWLEIEGPGGIFDYELDENFTYKSQAQKNVVDLYNTPIVFVGYGIKAPEYGWDDYKGADLKDKILLFLNNDPLIEENGKELFGGEYRTYYGRYTYKYEQALEQGAIGAIMIHTTHSAGYPFGVIQYSGSRTSYNIKVLESTSGLELSGWIDSTKAEMIAQSMGTNLEGLITMGSSRDFKPIETGFKISAHIENDIQTIKTRNVVGFITGSDPELKDQYIVLTAHYDHLGVNEQLEGDDKIYNGALDNALGTACIINLGEAFSSLEIKPKRSILFVACAAEEYGLLGSKAFVNDPPVELQQLIANFNIDSPQIFGLTTDISAVGLEMSTLGDEFRQVAESYGLEVRGNLNPNAGSFYRSDQLRFAQKGIPAIYPGSGRKYINALEFDLQEYFETHYHTVADEVNEYWDLTGCERDMKIQFQTILNVANNQDIPRWTDGNEFEDEWKELYNK